MKETVKYEALGKRVRAQRLALGWTQEYLAAKIGVSTSFIGHIERGSRKASVETLVQLSNAMHISTDVLLSDSIDRSGYEELYPFRDLTPGQRAAMKQIMTTMQQQILNWDSDSEK